MSGEHILESRVHQYLEEQKAKEKGKRLDLNWRVKQAKDSGKLPVDDKFISELEQVPLDWQIEIDENGAHFTRDFPYETPVYGVRGWDAARMVIDLDVANKTVAMRAHFYDASDDSKIIEGFVIEDQKVISYQREMIAAGMVRSVFAQIHIETESTKGKNGGMFDQFMIGIDKLPSLLRDLSGENYGRFLENFHRRVEEGEIDIQTMPDIPLDWPLLSPYQLATE